MIEMMNNTNNNNIYSHINEENKSHQITESVPTEELFLKQKEKIKIYKEKNSKNKKEKNLNQNINKVNSSKSIELLINQMRIIIIMLEKKA